MEQKIADLTAVVQELAGKKKNEGKRGICFSFRDFGKCRFGDNCRHKHVTVEKDSEKQKKHPSSEREKRGICFLYQRNGKCKFGDECKFKHVRKEKGKEKKSASIKKDGTCHSWRDTGKCKRQEECFFSRSHTPDMVDKTVKASTEMEKKIQEKLSQLSALEEKVEKVERVERIN